MKTSIHSFKFPIIQDGKGVNQNCTIQRADGFHCVPKKQPQPLKVSINIYNLFSENIKD